MFKKEPKIFNCRYCEDEILEDIGLYKRKEIFVCNKCYRTYLSDFKYLHNFSITSVIKYMYVDLDMSRIEEIKIKQEELKK